MNDFLTCVIFCFHFQLKQTCDILCDRVGAVVKIEDMTIQSRLWWYGHAMHGDINSHINEVMEVE